MSSSYSTSSTLPTLLHKGLPSIGALYSDYTLTCQGQEFKVHRLILHLHSWVFAKSFTSDTTRDRTEIYHVEPDVVGAMIDFCYKGNYEVPELETSVLFHLHVYQLASRYRINALLGASYRKFQVVCEGGEWAVGDFVAAARFVEDNALKETHELRAVVMHTVKARLDSFLPDSDFAVLLSEYRVLNVELLKSLGRGQGSLLPLPGKGKRRRGGRNGGRHARGNGQIRYNRLDEGVSGR